MFIVVTIILSKVGLNTLILKSLLNCPYDEFESLISPAMFSNFHNLLGLHFALNLIQIEAQRIKMLFQLIVTYAPVKVLVHCFH